MLNYVVLTILYKIKKGRDDQVEIKSALYLDEKRIEVFTLLVLFSFLGFLQYFRLLRSFRALIKMIIECTRDCVEFIVVLLLLLMGFACSTYYR
jgi:hypothetical protein